MTRCSNSGAAPDPEIAALAVRLGTMTCFGAVARTPVLLMLSIDEDHPGRDGKVVHKAMMPLPLAAADTLIAASFL